MEISSYSNVNNVDNWIPVVLVIIFIVIQLTIAFCLIVRYLIKKKKLNKNKKEIEKNIIEEEKIN